ncbi:CaiB/BaiF CoA-transferase family protein [Desulfurococcus sp.]|uniref:CaiB/BaiF CoA transferase family protein n=1 Tax=Desulfurococcus sp. TaxID=51678 RepID=UPI00319DADC2
MFILRLDGFRVLDLTRSLAGPFATMILGDLGAEVIKVEPPGGDETRLWAPFIDGESVYFLSINRNKKSIVIDLRTSEGRDILYKLASVSDIFIENFRPGVAEKLGIDYKTIRGINDRIVYCSIRGFGSGSPYENKPAYDLIVQAMSGIMTSTGEEGRPPVRIAFALFDMVAGLIAANSILSALLERQKSGRGSYIEVSLYESAVFAMSYIAMIYLLGGVKPKRYGHAHPSIVPYQAFQCSDNKWIAVAVTNDRFWNNLCKALNLSDICSDPRFKSNPDRVRNREELIKILEEIFSRKPRDYWLKILEEHDVPAGPVYEVDEVFEDPHIRSSGIVGVVEHSRLGQIKQLLYPALIDGERPKPRRAPPVLGEHTIEIMKELGYTEQQIQELVRRGVISTPSSQQL